jgi:hypothetical protein
MLSCQDYYGDDTNIYEFPKDSLDDGQRPLAFGEFVGGIRQCEHAMGVQASIAYALSLAVALNAGYQVRTCSQDRPQNLPAPSPARDQRIAAEYSRFLFASAINHSPYPSRDLYVDLAVVLGSAYCVCQYADRILGPGIWVRTVAWYSALRTMPRGPNWGHLIYLLYIYI